VPSAALAGGEDHGPALNKDAAGGDNDVMREFVENGTPRMPPSSSHFKPKRSTPSFRT
jgi:hypothetical protein